MSFRILKKYIRTYGEIKKRKPSERDINGETLLQKGLAGRFHFTIHIISSENVPMLVTTEMLLMIYTRDLYCNTIMWHLRELLNYQIAPKGTIWKKTKTHGKKNSEQIYHRLYFYCQCYAICNRRKKELEKNVLNYVGFPIKVLFLLKDPDWTNNIRSCAHGEKINQFHCSVIPILKSYQIQKSVPVVELYSFKEWNTFPL